MGDRKMRPPFYRLHALTLNPATTRDQLADGLRAAEAVADRHRLAEGAVYASACRRWLLDTGEPWTRDGDTTGSWGGQSDHRLRLTPQTLNHWTWACSCRATGVTSSEATARAAHAAHVNAAAAPQVCV